MDTTTLLTDHTISVTVPEAPDGDMTVTVTYDFGDVVVDAETATLDLAILDGPSTYSYDIPWYVLNAAGVYSVKWSAAYGGTTNIVRTNFIVEVQYITQSDFEAKLDYTFATTVDSAVYDTAERQARLIINTFCGQDFTYKEDKTIAFLGNGKSSFFLGQRLESFTSVLIDGDDYTTYFELDPSKMYLRFKNDLDLGEDVSGLTVANGADISVTGNWGWSYVPPNVVEATALLIEDIIGEGHTPHRFAVSRLDVDTQRTTFNVGYYDSTGNIDADVLLMDYTLFTLELA